MEGSASKKSLQLSESTEFDLELGDNVDNSIIDVRKLEVFAQNNLIQVKKLMKIQKCEKPIDIGNSYET